MNKFMERLGNLEVRVIPPAATAKGTGDVEDIRQFRAGVFGEFDSLPPTRDASADDADAESWHLVALREDGIVGCIRLSVLNPDEAYDMPRQTIANSRCQFSAPDKARCLAALSAYAKDWMQVGGPLVQVGGLAVERRSRKSVVAPALCLAANAVTRLLGGRSGVVFAAEKTGGASLYAKAGCFPLHLGDTELGLLPDSFHNDRILVMRADPRRVDPDLDEIVDAFCGRLDVEVVPSEVCHA